MVGDIAHEERDTAGGKRLYREENKLGEGHREFEMFLDVQVGM